MTYVLTFAGGALFGFFITALMVASGRNRDDE